METTTRWVIVDPPNREGDVVAYAYYTVRSGWRFTVVVDNATTFDSEEKARKAIEHYHPHVRGRLRVEKMA